MSEAKSLFHLLRRGSASRVDRTLEQDRDHDPCNQGRVESRSANLHQNPKTLLVKETADVDPRSSDRTHGIVEGEIEVPDFQVETSPEEFFYNGGGERAKGTFHRVHVVRWEQDETEWELDAEEFIPAANSAGEPPNQKDVRTSAIRVHEIASSHRWISPKSSRALAKLGNPKIKLDQSDINALNHLLERCANISQIASDVKILLLVIK